MLLAPPDPDEPVTAVCVSTERTDHIPAYAFTFAVNTGVHLVVYAGEPGRYIVNRSYALTISEPGHVPLRLPAAEWAFLRHCLHNVEQRWHDVIAKADAGTKQPPPGLPTASDRLDITPTPAGYQAMGRLFRTEAHHVRQLRTRLDHLLDAAGMGQNGGTW